jgi:hypothetical protein
MATKVKAVNKIVREASGVYNYTLVAPPRKKGEQENVEVYDADTHPLTKPYREAAKENPSMCSFGHRPSSASRTFLPATMKFRLKRSEIAEPNSKGGFGLTPANLAKIIKAPKYVSLADSLNMSEREESTASFGTNTGLSDPHGLFFNEEEKRLMSSKSAPATYAATERSSPGGNESTEDEKDNADGGASFDRNMRSGASSRMHRGESLPSLTSTKRSKITSRAPVSVRQECARFFEYHF